MDTTLPTAGGGPSFDPRPADAQEQLDPSSRPPARCGGHDDRRLDLGDGAVGGSTRVPCAQSLAGLPDFDPRLAGEGLARDTKIMPPTLVSTRASNRINP
jgi:hypothetical protein